MQRSSGLSHECSFFIVFPLGYYHEKFLKYRMFLCCQIVPKSTNKSMAGQAIRQQQTQAAPSPPALHPAVAALLPSHPRLTQLFINQAKQDQERQEQKELASQQQQQQAAAVLRSLHNVSPDSSKNNKTSQGDGNETISTSLAYWMQQP